LGFKTHSGACNGTDRDWLHWPASISASSLCICLVSSRWGLWVSRRQRTATDFFSRLAGFDLAGYRAGAVGLEYFLDHPDRTGPVAAYSMGIAVYNYEWMASVVLAFFCVFFLPFLLRSQVFTLPRVSGTPL
jgi:hypothetical protein